MSASATASPRERRRAEDLARRREDAISAAGSVFAEMGFYAAQMTEIAARAEVARATLYALFKTKDALYAEVIVTTARAVRDAVRAHVERLHEPGERLLGVIDALFACFEENNDLLRIYVRGTRGIPFRIRQELGDSSYQVFREFADWVETLAKEARDAGVLHGLTPRAVAACLVGGVTTEATQWVEETPELPLSRAAEGIRSVFVRLLERSSQA